MAKKKLYDENGNVVKGKIKKPFYKKIWFWVLIIILVAAIGGGMGGDETNTASEPESTSTKTVDTETVEEESSEKPKEEAKTYGISDEVNVGDVMYVVNGVETATNVGGEYGQNSKGTYLIVDISVTNNGSEALSISDDFFVLKNDGKEYKSDATAAIYANDDSSFFLESINPDLTMSGKVIFDVSDAVIESTTKQLQVATGYWSTKTALINLQ